MTAVALAYTRRFDFTDWQANHPTDPAPGTALDAEFNGVALSLNQLNQRQQMIQNDDGTLSNASVTLESLDQSTKTVLGSGFWPRGQWEAGTFYAAADIVSQQGVVYIAINDHTADAEFSTDLAEGLWMAFVQPIAAMGIPMIPIASLPGASNVQDALEQLAARVTALEAAP